MATEIIAGLGLFKTMLDTANGLKEMNDAAVRNAAVIELQSHILTAQANQSALIEEIRQLNERVAQFDAWQAEKQRYELKDFGGGTFAYSLKPDRADGDPAHNICPACYEKRQRSILQFSHRSGLQQEFYTCPGCNTQFKFGEKVESNRPDSHGGRRGRWTDR